ncbi:hypothetical protein OV079_23650 [Nannocystis pusilla]|uniref:Uncharacterized protein n=2 Tax=Nannocystis pusilla TaxID=889268 RepID=A0A9X3EQX6_9BACT|nr:hypothetical protein [Nannocystis pusilla]MCY1008497.1 hypothetical protein [Nannocystis pusilla]
MRILVGSRDEARADELRGVAVGYVDDELLEVFTVGELAPEELEALAERLAKVAQDLRAGRRSVLQ